MSIITLFYSIGFGLTIVAIISTLLSAFSYQISLLSSISHYAVIGGMYLPFVADAVIKMVGPRHRGFGSALIEVGDTVAIVTASIFSTVFHLSALEILGTLAGLYLFATTMQKKAECRPDISVVSLNK